MTSPASLNDCLPIGVLLLLNEWWQFGNLVLLNEQWRFGNLVSLNERWWFGNLVTLNIHWRFGILVLLINCWHFGIIPLLNINNRVGGFYRTRGSKLCFLTCFSSFSCYFLILVFLQNHYLLVSLRLSRMHRNPSSWATFLYFWHSKLVRCTFTPMFLAQNVWVSQSKMLSGTW
jgi:hypothetical protein